MNHGNYATWAGMVVAALLFGCAGARQDTVHQIATIDALMSGVFSGHVPCGSLLDNGNLGIGTFDSLDGEMVVLDGKIYQVKADGKVYCADPATKTPFATVCQFNPEKTAITGAQVDYEGLKQVLDAAAPEQNVFCAIRIEGTFPYMKTRSVPAQTKPYPPLAVVASNQPVFVMTNVHGTLVGFRCPAFVKGVNVCGYHLHFLNDEKTRGGHVLDLTVVNARCELDLCHRFVMDLPAGNEDFMKADLAKDRAEELKNVESKAKK